MLLLVNDIDKVIHLYVVLLFPYFRKKERTRKIYYFWEGIKKSIENKIIENIITLLIYLYISPTQ